MAPIQEKVDYLGTSYSVRVVVGYGKDSLEVAIGKLGGYEG